MLKTLKETITEWLIWGCLWDLRTLGSCQRHRSFRSAKNLTVSQRLKSIELRCLWKPTIPWWIRPLLRFFHSSNLLRVACQRKMLWERLWMPIQETRKYIRLSKMKSKTRRFLNLKSWRHRRIRLYSDLDQRKIWASLCFRIKKYPNHRRRLSIKVPNISLHQSYNPRFLVLLRLWITWRSNKKSVI